MQYHIRVAEINFQTRKHMSSYTWDFGAKGSGLAFSLSFDSAANTFTVKSSEGSFDLNALWFSDGDATKDGQWSLGKGQSALNMNGTSTVWDDVAVLSNPGLGKEGHAKSTFVSQGEEMTLSLDTLKAAGLSTDWISDWSNITIGVRATSVNGTGDGKLVDAAPTVVNSVEYVSVDHQGAWFDADNDGVRDANEQLIQADNGQVAAGFTDFNAKSVNVHFWELTGPTLHMSGFGQDDSIVVDLKTNVDNYYGYENTPGWILPGNVAIDTKDQVSNTSVYVGGFDQVANEGAWINAAYDAQNGVLYSYTNPDSIHNAHAFYGFDMARELHVTNASQIKFVLPDLGV